MYYIWFVFNKYLSHTLQETLFCNKNTSILFLIMSDQQVSPQQLLQAMQMQVAAQIGASLQKKVCLSDEK